MNKPSKVPPSIRPVASEPAKGDKPKTTRKPREARTVEGDLRKIHTAHQTKVQSLLDAKAKIESRLADINKQLTAAQIPLRKIEAVLAEDEGAGADELAAELDEVEGEPEPVAAGEVSP
jgi:uncharacterized protein involved in exopolysaccharide biosynthesis